MPGGSGGSLDIDGQDVRLAVVMNGGVSLAVWISGVTQELHRLATARRGPGRAYLPLLELLRATARVDVMAGTSAGGINGAFLALGLARGSDIEAMRDLWRDKGAVDKLLRDPLQKNPPSVLKGDDYFLAEVTKALRKVGVQGASGSAVAAEDREAVVELILSGTLWRGRESSFSDDLGVRITETDHDALFRFGWRADGPADSTVCDLDGPDAVDRLAAAARCTSSFPAAFEPHWVEVSGEAAGGEGLWETAAGTANFGTSQYVVDGGLLLNKPVRPALEAVYRQPAQWQVRRVLAYVVPDPGEQQPPQRPFAEEPTTREPLPTAAEVVLGTLTRLRSTDSVSRELAEIRRRNTDTHARRRARDRFAAALAEDAGQLAVSAWPAYIEARTDGAARTIGRLLAAGQKASDTNRWSETDLVAQIRRLLVRRRAEAEPFFIPQDPPDEAVTRTAECWDWGQTTVQRLRDLAVDVLRRALWLAWIGSPERRAIVLARAEASRVFKDLQVDRRGLEEFWVAASADPGRPIPVRRTDAQGRAADMEQLRDWLGDTLTAWGREPAGGADERRRGQYEQALGLAECLAHCADAISAVVQKGNSVLDPDGSERDRLKALYEYLLADASAGPEAVLERMLRLEVVQQAFSGVAHDVEQDVELVQFSAGSPSLVTGRQLHHFGAFWRSSWRVNDWIHGRMDGASQIVRTLLSPERLRQLGTVPDEGMVEERVEQLVSAVRACAVAADDEADTVWLAQQWQAVEPGCRDFVRDHVVSSATPLADSDRTAPTGEEVSDAAATDPRFVRCVAAVTLALHLRILREDLQALAAAVRDEQQGTAPDSPAGQTAAAGATQGGESWLRGYGAAVGRQSPLSPPDLREQWERAAAIGGQTIEDDIGTDYFARTMSRAAAVTAGVMGAPGLPGRAKRPVGMVLSALRGYTLAVWAMVTFMTSGSSVGRNAVHLAVAVGGTLLGVSLVVPGMPLALPLLGALLLIAGWSAAALLDRRTKPVGRKLLPLACLALLLVVGYGVWAWGHDGLSSLLGFLIKAGVVVMAVFIGWWISRAHTSPTASASPADERA
ncbi:patatin-like protein [Streptomyces sp. GbtcB6]|uniref:patatin-like protein n=1 Tax=Streptomyces sp. GbtcB6 TaxID=2824751 RepID=UPI001C2FDA42|nr:patatin-like protein [Streptomyces sp. GbtcB6]